MSAHDVLTAIPAFVLLVAVVAKLAVGRRERTAAVRGLTHRSSPPGRTPSRPRSWSPRP